MDEEYDCFAGVDWGNTFHQLCVLDRAGRIVHEGSFPHSGEGLARLVKQLLEHSGGHADRVAVGIETPRGAIVDTLLAQGFGVFAINPKQVDRFRDRLSVGGAKDDRRDGYVIGDALRTDRRRFRQLVAEEPLVTELREASRLHDELTEQLGRLSNQLRDELNGYYPQALVHCPAANEPWLWALLERVPTPQAGRRFALARLEGVLKDHRIRRVTSEDLATALRAPALHVGAGSVRAGELHVRVLIAQLKMAHRLRREVDERVTAILEEMTSEDSTDTPDEPEPGSPRRPSDLAVIRSLPGAGDWVVSCVVGEAHELLRRRDEEQLRTLSGAAPVTRQSGKRRIVVMRRACSDRLRTAMHHWAGVYAQHDPKGQALYRDLKERGKTHGHACRIVADRLFTVLFAMLRTSTLYDPTRREAAVALA